MDKDKEQIQETEVTESSLSLNKEALDSFFQDMGVSEQQEHPTAYSNEVIDNIQTIDPTLSLEEIQDLYKYLKGDGRPEFMEKMLTQTNEKLIETIKIMAILYLNKVPGLLEYQKALQKNLIDPAKIPDMSYDEIAKASANIQREISELLRFSLDVAKSLSNTNSIPTKIEKLANALMNVPESTRQRIEEIIEQDK